MYLSCVSSLLSDPLCLYNILNCTSHSRPCFSPCRAALGSETGFPLWVEEKAQIHAFFFRAWRFRFFCAFFLSRSALSLFFALFFLRAFALFFLRAFALFFSLRAREHESAKKAPAPTSAHWSSWSRPMPPSKFSLIMHDLYLFLLDLKTYTVVFLKYVLSMY